MFKDSALVFLARILNTLLLIPISIILARYLGVSDRGVFAVVTLIPAVISLAGNLGLSAAFVYISGRNKKSLKDVAIVAGISSVLLGTASILIYLPFAQVVHENFIKGEQYYYELLILPSIVPIMISSLFSSVLLGQLKIKLVTFINITFSLISAIVVISTATFDLGLKGLITLNLTSSYVSGIVFVALISKEVIKKPSFGWKHRLIIFKQAISYGLKSYIANLSQFFNYRLDTLLVSFFSGTTGVGIYSVAVTIGEGVWYISNSIASVLFPNVSKIGGTSLEKTLQINRLTFFTSFIVGFILIITSPYLVPFLFGNQFSGAVYPLMLLLPGVIVLSLANILASDFAGRNKPGVGAAASVLSLIVTILFDLILIPSYGPSGAAIASSLSYLTATIYIVWRFTKDHELGIFDVLILKKEDLIILMSQIRYELKRFKL